MENMKNIEDLEDFDNIEDLDDLEDFDDIENFDDFEDFDSIKKFDDFEELENIDDSDDFENLDNIEKLEDLDDLYEIDPLDDIEELNDFEDLDDIEDIEHLDNIDDIENQDDIEDLEYIENLEYTSNKDSKKYNKNNSKKNRKINPVIIVSAVVIICFLTGLLIAWLISLFTNGESEDDYNAGNNIVAHVLPLVDREGIVDTAIAEDSEEIEIVDPEIDWDALISNNPDVYGYVYVPGTKVSYPIVQSDEDNFYLTHDINGKNSKEGSIYTNSDNEKNFDGRVTVLYGHNMRNGNMFGSLKQFYQNDFYLEHPWIVVYTPENRYIYQIVAARRHSDAYLFDEFNGYSDDGMKRFREMAAEPVSDKDKDVSHITETELNESDKFIVLSVCIGNETTNRYLVIGKLL